MKTRRLTSLVLLSSRTATIGTFTLSSAVSSLSTTSKNRTILLNALTATSTSHSLLEVHHVQQTAVGSTQDEARKLLQARVAGTAAVTTNNDGSVITVPQQQKCLAVIADLQSAGRGTQGRKWEGGGRKGNLYLTVCVPYDDIPVMITLLPLQVAVLVAERVEKLMEACLAMESVLPEAKHKQKDMEMPKVNVKWPNDVLVNDSKISGTLIENEIVNGQVWMIIGIGLNVAFAPSLTESPGKQVRGATYLQSYCPQHTLFPEDAHVMIGRDLAHGLIDWVYDKSIDKANKETKVVDDWKSFAEFGKTYELRGKVEEEDAGHFVGEEVVSVDIQYDGQLLVRCENGRERLLIADYMF